jgi:hypothetical protein
MKKVILTLAAVLCCASLFTSCKKDSGSQSGGTGTAAYVVMSVKIPCTANMLEYTNMSISYEAGNEKNTETVTGSSWSKEFKVKLPGTIKIDRTVTLRDDRTIPADDSFTYTKGYNLSWKFVDENGKDVRAGGISGIDGSSSGKGSKVKELIEQGKLNISLNYPFDKDGNLPKSQLQPSEN